MAKVKVNLNVPKLTNRVKTQVGRFLKDAKIEKDIQEEMVKSIKGRLLKGPRLPNGKKVKALTRETIERRRKLEKTNATGDGYKASRSNLTFTGELLSKGIRSKFIIKGLQITIEPTGGSHKKYKKPNGKKYKGRQAKYRKIFEGQAAQGRDVFDISQKFLDNVTKIVRKKLKKFLS